MVQRPGISLITPTGDRPASFALLVRWVERMAQDVEWVVVDDGEVSTDVPSWAKVVRLEPMDGPSVARNYLAGIAAAKGDTLIYLEDDEWYHQDYVANVANAFVDQSVELVGVAPWRAWYLQDRCFREERDPKGTSATTSRTAVRRGHALNRHKQILRMEAPHKAGETRLWRSGFHRVILNRPELCVSLKDVPGRPKPLRHNEHVGQIHDPDAKKLMEWIGEADAKEYLQMVTSP